MPSPDKGPAEPSPNTFAIIIFVIRDFVKYRVAEVGGTQTWHFPKGQGLLRKKGPPRWTILLRNWLLSQFTQYLKGFRRAFNESHHSFGELFPKVSLLSTIYLWRAFNKSQPAFREHSMKVSLLLEIFQRKLACFQRAFREIWRALNQN